MVGEKFDNEIRISIWTRVGLDNANCLDFQVVEANGDKGIQLWMVTFIPFCWDNVQRKPFFK